MARILILLLMGNCFPGYGLAYVIPVEDSAAVAGHWFRQGNGHLIHREWTMALQAYRHALQLSPAETERASIHQNLGALYFLLADYEQASIQFEHAFHLLVKQSPEPSHLAEVCLNLGFTCLEKEDPAAARRWFDQSASFPIQERNVWQTRLALGSGNALFADGRYLEAISTYRRSLSSIPLTDPVSEEELWLLKNLAWSFQATGEPDSALVVLDHALNRISLCGRRDPFVVPEILLQKSILLTSTGKLTKADKVLGDALLLTGEVGSPAAVPHVEPCRLTTWDLLTYRILCERVQVRWRMLIPGKRDSLAGEALLKETVAVMELGELLLMNGKLKELVSLQPGTQRILTGIALELIPDQEKGPEQILEQFICFQERLIRFEKQCRFNMNISREMLPDTLKSDLIGLKKQLFRLHKRRLFEEEGSLLPAPDLVEKEVKIQEQLSQLEQPQIPGPENPFLPVRDQMTSGIPCNPLQLRSMMQKDEALITYLVADSLCYTLLLTSDTALFLRQPGGNGIIHEAGTCIKALRGLDPQVFTGAAAHLYASLVKPVEKHLHKISSISIIPDEKLRELPFDVLLTNEAHDPGARQQYLIHRFETSCYTSISSWFTERKGDALPAAHYSYSYDFVGCAPLFSGAERPSLPYAVSEVQKIAAMFRSERKQVKVLTGTGIIPDTLISLGARSRIFHLATHGSRDHAHPELSGWVLPGDPAPSPDGGIPAEDMEMGALQHFQMDADLVVLSSCPVTTANAKSWYRITGFPENFFHAGVHHLLYALWDISDRHTDEFMHSFYRHYLDGMSYQAALREAKLQMLASPETAFPTFWASFVLWTD